MADYQRFKAKKNCIKQFEWASHIFLYSFNNQKVDFKNYNHTTSTCVDIHVFSFVFIFQRNGIP